MSLSTAELPSTKTRRLIIIGMLAFAAALMAIAVIVYQGNPRSTDLPVAIQSVSPESNTNVLSQSDITVDLAVGYTAELEVNGVAIPEEQLFRATALNSLTFRPGPDQVIDGLLPDRNCVRVFYWLISQGENGEQSFTWCFDAS